MATDGTIYAAGSSEDKEAHFAVLVTRLTGRGSLDPSFGKEGAVIGNPQGVAAALSVEPDEYVTVAGFGVERFTSRGTLDPRFDAHQLAMSARALQRLPSGNLVAAGEPEPEEWKGPRVPATVEMLSSNGAPDPSFGHDGMVELFDYSGEHSQMTATSVLRQSNGDVVVGGFGAYETRDSQGRQGFFWLARLTASGALDTTFGEDGMTIVYRSPTVPGPALVEPRPDGLALVGTSVNQEGNDPQMTVWGLTSRGAPDLSFGSGGVLVVPLAPGSSRSFPSAATVNTDGRLLVTGRAGNGTQPEIVRIEPDGRVDPSFGQQGIAQGPPASCFNALIVNPSGRLLAAGYQEVEGVELSGRQPIDALVERFLATEPPSVSPKARRAAVRLLTSQITSSSSGEVRIKLACVGAGVCRGKLTLTTTAKHARRAIIGTATFEILAPKKMTIKLRLNRIGQGLLRAHHYRLPATLTILKTSPSPRRRHENSIKLV